MCARTLVVVIGLSAVLAACRSNASWKPRPPVRQPPTRVIGGIPVVTLSESLPDLTEAEVAYVVGLAEKETKGLRVRRIVHSWGQYWEHRYLEVVIEPEETHARVRLSRSIVADQAEKEEGDVGPETWSLFTEHEPILHAEICAPGCSFLDETPVPQTYVVHIGVGGDPTADEIIEAVDAVYGHVPAGETLTSIYRHDDGSYEFGIRCAEDFRPPSKSSMFAERGSRGWEVWEETWIGE